MIMATTRELRDRYAKHGFAGLNGLEAKQIIKIMNSTREEFTEHARMINNSIRNFRIARSNGPWGCKCCPGPKTKETYDADSGEWRQVPDSPIPPGPVDHGHDRIFESERAPRFANRLAAAKEVAKDHSYSFLPIHKIFFFDGLSIACPLGDSPELLESHEPYMRKRVAKDLDVPYDEVTQETFQVWSIMDFEKPLWSPGWLKAQQDAEKEENAWKVRLFRPQANTQENELLQRDKFNKAFKAEQERQMKNRRKSRSRKSRSRRKEQSNV
ncbi:hypothetical protein BT63DRAFT_44697 [Microthyrium microscopicum]|uniref:Uncharacterized protein n=1 Tax=Microthyrium microscopicum TaxID=703497 RepID=A0A6A6U4R4_9PEZI|nr:hypothetical protein BT63DRAFT_44697 [Microthyrium microscopicum]